MAIGPRTIRHWALLATDSHYREMDRLLKLPRHTPGMTRLLGAELRFVDGRACALQYRAIFENHSYAAKLHSAAPRIIDAGANIGLATIYFKKAFPRARIDAFEADPRIAEVLRTNVASFDLDDVTVHHAAVSDRTSNLQFVSSGADGGHVARATEQEKTVSVPAVRLRDWLEEPIDLLKMDVEGSESDIIADCRLQLRNVSRLFVEYHSFINERQRLAELFGILGDAGFTTFVQTTYCPPSPLLDPGWGMQLDIFCTRLD